MAKDEFLQGNPLGYGATTPAQVLTYLTRSVNQVSLAAPEEQYAARLISQLLSDVGALKAEVADLKARLASPPEPETGPDTILRQRVQALKEEVLRLQARNEKAAQEYRRDGQRIAFCLQESVYSAGDYLVGHFERVPVEDGDYRRALDDLMGS